MDLIGHHAACGKVILLGEHFVVHGVPAVAVPLTALGTTVEVYRDLAGGEVRLESDAAGADLGLANDLMRAAVDLILPAEQGGGLVARVRSTIPVGYGLGSSAALAVALAGALCRAAGETPGPERLNALAHELERVSHGRPSGIDDTVVSRREPLLFSRAHGATPLRAGRELRLVLASSGQPGSTREAVAGVGAFRQANREQFDALCQEAAQQVMAGRAALEAGDLPALGQAMDRIHAMLQQLDVSTATLDRLVVAAREAGALGAKLTGSGRGGFCVALCPAGQEEALAAALERAGSPLVVHPASEAPAS